jgi:hypothetical protein
LLGNCVVLAVPLSHILTAMFDMYKAHSLLQTGLHVKFTGSEYYSDPR